MYDLVSAHRFGLRVPCSPHPENASGPDGGKGRVPLYLPPNPCYSHLMFTILKHIIDVLFPRYKRHCPHCGGGKCFGVCGLVKDQDK